MAQHLVYFPFLRCSINGTYAVCPSEKINLFVFILQDIETGAIRGVCDELELAKKLIEINKKWSFPDVGITAYHVKSTLDFNSGRPTK